MDAIVYNLETQVLLEGQPVDEEALELETLAHQELQAA
jgi:hypothetical protein